MSENAYQPQNILTYHPLRCSLTQEKCEAKLAKKRGCFNRVRKVLRAKVLRVFHNILAFGRSCCWMGWSVARSVAKPSGDRSLNFHAETLGL